MVINVIRLKPCFLEVYNMILILIYINKDFYSGKKPMNFARNPEEIRNERERRHQEKMARRNRKGPPGGGGGGGGSAPSNGGGAAPPNRDVVGRAKGQGQDKNVVINRARKNANKGKSQRNAADKKMSKGMY